jgi:hypothetical protein
MTEHLAKRFVDHRGVALAAQRVGHEPPSADSRLYLECRQQLLETQEERAKTGRRIELLRQLMALDSPDEEPV